MSCVILLLIPVFILLFSSAARVLWRRSVERHKLRYTVLLSHGDAKTFAELTKIKPYGDDVMIEKEECINHVNRKKISIAKKDAKFVKLKIEYSKSVLGHGNQ